ncbi:RNA-directed DNA polymerase from mobile element jockey, partial [Aphis craccivora]
PFDIRLKQYYNLYRNILNKLVRLSKQLYYQKRLQQHAQSDTKLVWNIINEITGKPNQIIRNNVGKNLDIEQINANIPLPQNNTDINDSLFLKQIDKNEITKLINKIKNHNSYFENNLTNYILKNVSNSIAFPLSIIFNHSFSTVILIMLIIFCFNQFILKVISIWGGAANNVLSKLIVTINCIIKFLLNLPMTTNTSSIYKEINLKHLKCIYKSSVLVQLS